MSQNLTLVTSNPILTDPSTEFWYLMGIKGVAMASLAQILIDAGHRVAGCDVAEDFVTAELLSRLPIELEVGFDHLLPTGVTTLVYTAAHQGQFNPMVQQSRAKGVRTLSQAEALAEFFNQKQGVAVCGVGGKSTVSAMITWILEKIGQQPSFSVGVGSIPGLDRTGQWLPKSQWFVAEADEYVIDPSAPSRDEPIVPRFSFFQPFLTVCTNLEYDHPDVYRDFSHTQTVFRDFFSQIKPGGVLIINQDSVGLQKVMATLITQLATKNITLVNFGETATANWWLSDYQVKPGQSQAKLHYQNQIFELLLPIPGKFNLKNALAAVAAVVALGFEPQAAVTALADFHSTKRRFELIGTKNGVIYYDDYGHHPHEVYQAIKALNDWYPAAHKLIVFQSHTFSRTKQLFAEFVEAFREADEVAMIEIFPSAREAFDASVTSDGLCAAITAKYPTIKVKNYRDLKTLATYCQENLKPGDVCLTIGAGDVYVLHDLL